MVDCVLSVTGTGTGMLLFCCREWLDKVLIIVTVAIGYFYSVFMLWLKLSWFTKSKIYIYIFPHMLQLCNIIYKVKAVCWYVCLSLVFIISD